MRAARCCAALLVAVLAALGLGAGPAAAGDGNPYAADRVVIVGVPGLLWSDVDPASTPALAALAGDASIGALSVRAARSFTCLLDGWATLGAGNRAHVPDPAPPAEDGGSCVPQERLAARDLADPAPLVAATTGEQGTRSFGSRPGALGASAGCAQVAGPAAALAVAAPGARVAADPALPPDPAGLAGFLSGCRLSLVSLDQLVAAADDPAARATALAAVDGEVARLRAAVGALPGRTLLLVEGVSEVGAGRPQLHVAIAAGPGFPAGRRLASASTGRAPYVQLIDAAPTALRALGLDVPPSMNGQPMRPDGARPATGAAIAQLVRDETAASVHYRSTGGLFWTLVGLTAALVAAGVVLLRRRPPAGTRALRAGALLVAAVPVATYLAGLAPWVRAGAPRWALFGAVAGAAVVVAALAGLGPWRRARFGPALAVLAITAGTLVADVATGSHLELNGLLGYDAIVAGRFVGYGNLSFALLAVSGLLLATALATTLARRAGANRARRVAAVAVLACGCVVVAIDGAPGLGRDFGGVLSAVPGFLLLALLLARARITVARVAAILGAAVVAVGAVAVLDWRRPPADRTHLGRFVQQLIDGGAWTVVARKAQSNLSILVHSPLTWLLPVALLAAVWLLRRGGPLRGRTGRDGGALRAGLTAVALTLAIGAAVNDSGVALPAAAAALLVPLLVWLAAAPSGGDPAHGATAGGTSGAGPGADPHRVTVGSRGSTAWNA